MQWRLVREFNEKVKTGAIEFEYVPCLCGSNVFDLVASVDKFSMLQQTVLCNKCGLIQSNPRMTKEEYADFYTSDLYRKCYESENYLQIYENKYIEDTARHIFDEVNKIKKVDSNCSVLEIGAGGGWNLIPFIEKGANVFGIDYSKSLVILGKKHGINMGEGNIDSVDGVYDIIVINHVLEHLINPVDSLKGLFRNLKKDGLIYIAVPNILNFDMDQLQNAHTYYFSPWSFLHYCRSAGLKNIVNGTSEAIHMFGIFKFSDAAGDTENYYENSFMENKYMEIYSHLRQMRFKQGLNIILSNLHMRKFAGKVFHALSRRS